MKKIKFSVTKILFAYNRFLVLTLCVLCVSVVNLPAQDFKTVHDGIEYAEVTKEISGLKVSMNLLRLDLTKVRLDVHHEMDAAIGTEKTSSIATRHGAFAAINAGFFRLDNSIWAGDAAGLLMIDGKLLSEGIPGRLAMWISGPMGIPNTQIIDDKQDVRFSRQLLRWRVRVGTAVEIISGVNRERKSEDLVIYTPDFGQTTLTDGNGIELIIQNQRILGLSRSKGCSKIPSLGYVLSANGSFANKLSRFRIGEKVELGTQFFDPQEPQNSRGNVLLPSYDIVGGVPQLIKDGKIDITWEQEKQSKSFVETRHPRTAVAKLKDGKFLMITVDGRSESSGGIGLQDLAEYLLILGATDAMNLDGGGSTTMFLDGKVVNHPSDKEGERKVSNAILVTPRKK